MRWNAGLVVLSIALLAASAASAQTYRSEVTVFTGVSFLGAVNEDPDVGFEERFEQTFVVGMRYGFVLDPRFTIEASYRYSPNGKSTVAFADSLFAIDLAVPFDRSSHAVGANVVYYLTTWNNLRPFVTGGAGAEVFLLDGDAETSLRSEAGFGLRWGVREGLALRLDAKYVFLKDFYVTGKNEGAAEIQIGLVVGL